MGTLSGWWLGEADNRPNEPYLQASQWNAALLKAGFGGVETAVMDEAEPYQLDNIIIARAVETDPSPRKQLNLLVTDTSVISPPIKTIKTQFESSGYDVSLCSLWDAPSSGNIVSLLDVDGPKSFFQELSEKDLRGLISFISHSLKSKVLWVTGPAQMSVKNPHYAMILGFARSLRLELGATFATLELDVDDKSPSLWSSVVQVFEKVQRNLRVGYSSSDSEFAFVNSTVCVPRFTTSNVETLLSSGLTAAKTVGKRLHVSKPGLLSSLKWIVQSRDDVLSAGEVEVEVRTASVNSWVCIFSNRIGNPLT